MKNKTTSAIFLALGLLLLSCGDKKATQNANKENHQYTDMDRGQDIPPLTPNEIINFSNEHIYKGELEKTLSLFYDNEKAEKIASSPDSIEKINLSKRRYTENHGQYIATHIRKTSGKNDTLDIWSDIVFKKSKLTDQHTKMIRVRGEWKIVIE